MFKLIKFFASPWASIAITLVVLLVLIIVAKFLFGKQKLLFRTVLIGLLLVAGGSIVLNLKNVFKPAPKPLTSISLFKKVEYVEELKLVSFYSEEVVVLGTKEKVQKVVDNIRDDIKDLKLKELIAKAKLKTWESTLFTVYEELAKGGTDLSGLKNDLGNLKSDFRLVKRCKKKESCRPDLLDRLPAKDSIFFLDPLYTRYNNTFGHYQGLAAGLKADVWKKNKDNSVNWKSLEGVSKKRQRRRIYKDSLQVIARRFEDEHNSFSDAVKRYVDYREDSLSSLVDLEKMQDKALRKREKDAKGGIKKSQKDWEKIVRKLRDQEAKLVEAEIELEFARREGEDIEPEILVVLPAEVSVHIDMSKVGVDEDSLQIGIAIITIPEIEFDSVMIELSTEGMYDLDQKDKELESSKQGAYYDFFGQLKQAIIEKQTTVKDKAIENGIVEEGRDMAKMYLKNFIAPLGYEIRFVDSEEEEEEPLMISEPIADAVDVE